MTKLEELKAAGDAACDAAYYAEQQAYGMNEEPERIWAWQGTDPLTDKKWDAGEWYTEDVGLDGDEIEYIRADIHEARIDEMEEALFDMVDLFSADDMLLKGTHLHTALYAARAALQTRRIEAIQRNKRNKLGELKAKLDAAWDAYQVELKKIQKENSND
jgi:hypothetical protein